MFDPKKLLDQFLGSQAGGNLANRMGGGGLGGLADMLGGNPNPGAGSAPGGAQSTGDILRERAGQATEMARNNPLAAGAIAAVLLGTGAGRQIGGTALKLGGLAAIGGLAYKAYQNYQAGQQPVPNAPEPELLPPPVDTGFHPSQAPQGEDEFALMLVRAMIAAAKADGHIDEQERGRIAGKLSLQGLDGEGGDFIMKELERPLDIDALAASARTEEQKVELFTAARLAIEPDSRAERGFLDMLAGRLNLPDALIDHIEATVSSAKVPAPASEPQPTSVPSVSPSSKW